MSKDVLGSQGVESWVPVSTYHSVRLPSTSLPIRKAGCIASVKITSSVTSDLLISIKKGSAMSISIYNGLLAMRFGLLPYLENCKTLNSDSQACPMEIWHVTEYWLSSFLPDAENAFKETQSS